MKIRGLVQFRVCILMMALLLTACDDQDNAETSTPSGITRPPQSDLNQGQQIARAAGIGAIVPRMDGITPPPGNGDLGVLGGSANQNQEAFRQRFGLADPTRDQLAQWEEYDARLTAYSDKDADWPYPTAASSNWMGTTWTNSDPLAIEGTTVAVDFERIPPGSLIYIPALDMYAEANDTGPAESISIIWLDLAHPAKLNKTSNNWSEAANTGKSLSYTEGPAGKNKTPQYE